jgi:acyl-CoA thioester hydrolase
MTSNGEPFRWRFRVYYEDTDLSGVVYYANYLKFMERARTEWLRTLGFEMSAMAENHGCQFVVQRAAIEYRAPARLDDELTATVTLGRHSHARLVLAQGVERNGVPLVEGTITLACITTDTWKPAPMPRPLKRTLENLA